MKFLATILLAIGLTGCAGFDSNPLVEVANNALEEPTIKSGMTSRDAAYMAAYKAYIKEATKNKPIVEIESTGEEIKITGLKSLKVYGNNDGTALAAPTKDKPLIIELMDGVGRFAERVLLPGYLIKESHQTARDQSTKDLEATRIISGERERVTSQALEAASKPPLVVTVPAPTAAPISGE